MRLKRYFVAYLQLLRPHQWIKNSFVLIGVIFGDVLHHTALLSAALTAAVAFCLLSSSTYIYNDIIDISDDILHPVKRHRPLPSRAISLHTAIVTALLLFIAAIFMSLLVSTYVTLFLLSYALLNVLYCHWLKNIVILDVFAIAMGFMLRILTGTVGLNIAPSPWLLFCGLSLTLFLGFTKRRAEIYQSKEARKVLKNYHDIFLDKMIVVTASCSIITYALYTMNPEIQTIHHTKNLIYSVPFVIYGIFRYLYLLHSTTDTQRRGEDTAKDLMGDKQLLFTLLGWVLTVVFFLYFPA